ncbi:hypothetical protein OIU84_011399 [Salix udensis]|uniref:CUE domain-containing protein n=1 Tax=Salix udensis TaxID=889485 RepID=A0AAD6NWZ3_9ROSI|nr:hypothetical protein OIU84_011399 [Salix udensis]
MSAIVCGKRSFFEELTVSSPPVSKRIRCSSSSPVRFSPPRSNTLASNPASFNFFSSSASSSSTSIEQLAAIFPDMDNQLLEKALEECGDDLDSAIRSLNELRLASVENFSSAVAKSNVIDKANVPPQVCVRLFAICGEYWVLWNTMENLLLISFHSDGRDDCKILWKYSVFFIVLDHSTERNLVHYGSRIWALGWWCFFGIDGVLNGKQYFVVGLAPVDSEAHPTEDPSASAHLSMDGMEWVELFVREMTSASNIDDARARASRALEALEKSICTRAGAETAKSFNQENMMLKEQMQILIQENSILKRAVSIQHERQKEFEESSQELQQLKQLVSQYQDQLRTLEVNNYALTLHLKQAQQSSSMPGRFHPDVF